MFDRLINLLVSVVHQTQQHGQFSGFSFYLIYSNLRAEESGSLEMPPDANQKATTKDRSL